MGKRKIVIPHGKLATVPKPSFPQHFVQSRIPLSKGCGKSLRFDTGTIHGGKATPDILAVPLHIVKHHMTVAVKADLLVIHGGIEVFTRASSATSINHVARRRCFCNRANIALASAAEQKSVSRRKQKTLRTSREKTSDAQRADFADETAVQAVGKRRCATVLY